VARSFNRLKNTKKKNRDPPWSDEWTCLSLPRFQTAKELKERIQDLRFLLGEKNRRKLPIFDS